MLQPVLYICGIFLTGLSVVMAALPLADFFTTGIWNFEQILLPCGLTSFVGLFLFLANRSNEIPKLSVKHAFLLTTCLWCLIPLFASLPFYFDMSLHLSFWDAWFEAVSVLTTTGLSVIKDLPLSLSLWKLILCYVGGIGMVLMGMIALPFLRIGGMSLFRAESSETSEKILPNVVQIAANLIGIYTLAMVVCWAALRIVNVPNFEAINLAISSVSTCGMSFLPISASAKIILVISMFFGGSSLYLYLKALRREEHAFKQDRQFHGYIKILICFSIITLLSSGLPLSWQNICAQIFNSISIMTTTGFPCESINFPLGALILIGGLIGGCTGSTAGGIKILRWQVVFASIRAHLSAICHPYRLSVPVYQGQKITSSVLLSVYSYIMLYFITLLSLAFCLSLFHFNFSSSLFAAASVIGNTGIGPGDIIGSQESLINSPWGVKFLLMIGMILGRLELLTVLALLMPSFWKK